MERTLIDERYELRRRVGGGGMADVYLARDKVLDRNVALKLLKARYTADEQFVERFKREARHAAALSHPNIVPIYDRGEDPSGTYYIAMEYLPGGSLKERMPEDGILPPRTAVAVALQIAEALQDAHERGVVHRDIKPRNVLVTGNGDVKVTDFGIARAVDATTISDAGTILGTASYMSPEQAASRPVGPQSDLYSLGVVLYEMLTGALPFEIKDPPDVPARHDDGLPHRPSELNPEVPQSVDAVVMRLLETDPMHRHESAAELMEDLERAQDAQPAMAAASQGEEATDAPAPATSRLRSTRAESSPGSGERLFSRLMVALAVLVALIGVGVGGWSLWRASGDGGVSGVPELTPGGSTEGRNQAEVVEVPAVEGLLEEEARGRLDEAGLRAQVQTQESSEENSGRVIEQSVPGGERADRGSQVLLAIGEGQQAGRVPDLVGMSFAEAEVALQDAGYLLDGIEEVPSDSAPAGVVTAQDPAPDTESDPGAYVFLTVSSGPPVQYSDPYAQY